MNREEAVRNIKEHCYFAGLKPEAKKSLDMAVKALDPNSSGSLDDIEDALHIAQAEMGRWRKRALKMASVIGVRDCDIDDYEAEENEIISISKHALKKVTGRFVVYDIEWLKKHFYDTEEFLYGDRKSCDDTISRQAALNLADEVETKRLRGDIDLTYAPMVKGLRGLPKVEPELPKKFLSEDCISRSDIYKKVEECDDVQKIKYEIANAQTLYPENKVGKWERYHGDDISGFYGHPYCTVCDAFAPYKANGEEAISPYCPNCGAKMEGME